MPPNLLFSLPAQVERAPTPRPGAYLPDSAPWIVWSILLRAGGIVLGAFASAILSLAALGVAALSSICRPLNAARTRRGPPVLPALKEVSCSIIILTYQGRHLLRRNLPVVLGAVDGDPSVVDVIVVDNGSTDGTAEWMAREFPEIRLIALPRNYFFARANDIAARIARGNVLVFLNNDMRPAAGFHKPLLDAIRAGAFAATSTIEIEDADRRGKETGNTRFVLRGGLCEVFHAPRSETASANATAVSYAGGGSSAYRREPFLRLDGFDPLFEPFYSEDVDLSWRAWSRGWPSVLVPGSHVVHAHRATALPLFGLRGIHLVARRNKLLLTWLHLRGPAAWTRHLLGLPLLCQRWAGLYGASALSSLLHALVRLPRVAWRRLCFLATSPRRVATGHGLHPHAASITRKRA